jgi:hypothetical protein
VLITRATPPSRRTHLHRHPPELISPSAPPSLVLLFTFSLFSTFDPGAKKSCWILCRKVTLFKQANRNWNTLIVRSMFGPSKKGLSNASRRPKTCDPVGLNTVQKKNMNNLPHRRQLSKRQWYPPSSCNQGARHRAGASSLLLSRATRFLMARLMLLHPTLQLKCRHCLRRCCWNQ